MGIVRVAKREGKSLFFLIRNITKVISNIDKYIYNGIYNKILLNIKIFKINNNK